jgi:hypothetical protein
MAGDAFSKNVVDDEFVPNSILWNAMIDTVLAFLRKTPQGQGSVQLVEDDAIYVRNVSEAAIAQFGIVGLGQLLTSPANASDEVFRNQLIFDSAAPDPSNPFGVVQQPIADGEHYAAIAPNMGYPSRPPGANWQIFVGSVAAWNSGTAYILGNRATQSGSAYICIRANTNNIPPNATYWLLLGADRGPWNLTTAYIAGDQVVQPRMGTMFLAGVSRCMVNITDAAHHYAAPIAGDYAKLESCAAKAPARIIWRAGGGGLQWAVIAFCCDFPEISVALPPIPQGALLLVGYIPSISVLSTPVAPRGSLTLTGYVPSIYGQTFAAVPPRGKLKLTGYLPNIIGPASALIVPRGSIKLAGYVPSIIGPNSGIVPPRGSILLAGYAPSIYGPKATIVPPRGKVKLTGYAPTVTVTTGGGFVRTSLGTASSGGANVASLTKSVTIGSTGILVVVASVWRNVNNVAAPIRCTFNGLDMGATINGGNTSQIQTPDNNGICAIFAMPVVAGTHNIFVDGDSYLGGPMSAAVEIEAILVTGYTTVNGTVVGQNGTGSAPDVTPSGASTASAAYIQAGALMINPSGAFSWANGYTSGGQDVSQTISADVMKATEGYLVVGAPTSIIAALSGVSASPWAMVALYLT